MNIHLYRLAGAVVPVPVTIAVSVKHEAMASARQVLATKLELRHEGDELTAFRFVLDEGGRVVPGSVHDLPKPLRSG